MSIFNLKTVVATTGVYLTASAAMAQSAWYYPWHHTPTTTTTTVRSVPEIDASAGLLAVATVAAALVFVWERRRRATS